MAICAATASQLLPRGHSETIGGLLGKGCCENANLPCIELKIKQQDRACEVALRCNEPALSNYFLQLVQELECWRSQEKGTDVYKHKPAAKSAALLVQEIARLSGETPVVALGERSVAIGGNVSNSLIIVGNAKLSGGWLQ